MMKIKQDSAKIDEIIKSSQNFEVHLIDLIKRSERRAWSITIASVVMSILLAAGYFMIMPLKEKIPYLVMTDSFSGVSSIAKVNGNFVAPNISLQEVIDKSNITRFVIARESYDWRLISRRDANTVISMAEDSVRNTYFNLFAKSNPNNPDVIYADNKIMRVRIKSISFLGVANGQPSGATVRFDRFLIDKNTIKVLSADSYIATMSFAYQNNLNMSEELRVENPLGFRVSAYRIDPEDAGKSALIGGVLNENILEIASQASGAALVTPTESIGSSQASGAALVNPK